MLCKLAWGNVRRAGRDYLVYLLTLTLGVTVFYAFNTISMQVDIAGIDEKGLAQVMGSMLGYLTYFLAGVMAFLMVYANNFIMKRRKKEFGLYQVLGMGRGRVATIMALETVIVSVVAFVAGIVLGVLGGLGGIVYIIAGVSEWKFENGVAGFGFLALAVMIFGQWKPTRIALAALLFGFFRALGNVYSGFDLLSNLNLPSSVYNMLPYVISLVVLAFTSQKSRAPKAEGIPYDKGQR